MTFEWNPVKDAINRLKHGVSFEEAQRAFADPSRVLAEDLGHGKEERRLFCFGLVGGDVLTVRFLWRNGVIRIFGAGYWRKGKQIDEREKKYTDEDIGNPRVIPNFLPPPDKLVFREDGVKVTITLSQRSIDFFKAHAAEHGAPYQRMIRNLLDAYVDSHAGRSRATKPARKRPAR